MKKMHIEHYLFAEDSVMEDCLIELPPFGSFPMRGFRKKIRGDFFPEKTVKKIAIENQPPATIKIIAA